MDSQEEYDDLISQYQIKLQELRVAERRRRDQSIILFLDKERNAIHNKLRKLGLSIGKSSQDIMLDILASEGDLSEYQLPEFKVLRTARAMNKIDLIFVMDDKGGPKETITYQALSHYELPKHLESFIPFGEQENWHLFDNQGYTFHSPDEEERKTRMHRLIDMSSGSLQEVEIISYDSFHNATTLFGVACSADDLEKIFSIIREHRTEISISRDFFDNEKIKEDFLRILEKDLNYILERDLDEHETYGYLVKRLKEYVIHNVPMDAKMAEKVNDLFESYIEKAVYIDRKKEVDIETSAEMDLIDETERKYPKESQLPKRTSMNKR
ncbi:MAG: hypothetical protein COU32_00140 [Candidatus Magasanikbacteria bacterium CG10_big_fil_rev_8_21_14_0_10_42_10]|uniref:Uncharacterized protein n=2 Tax=Candidatus Magasanikiibacteriota TaxID=1752731 RepID=A0A2H0TZI9_9BACT|nr:MAG: hypothetical protein COU32_00140 [Candidatus Magasanikbacteria bacterium CG10_big_fil_rev_8_21_14_0_10_42_10]PIZ94708.1 MAG: hypothetical protein COX82_00175 [Candidatus Magasanikbacteria bacterium CG_4_10_14_0_2_um_filter_41_10]